MIINNYLIDYSNVVTRMETETYGWFVKIENIQFPIKFRKPEKNLRQ